MVVADRPYLRERARIRDEFEAAGAAGAIDRVAVAALTAAGKDPLKVLTVAVGRPDGVWVSGDPDVKLRWRMGTLVGEVELAPGIRWDFGKVSFAPDRADPAARFGRPARDYVQSPHLAGSSVVRSCKHELDGALTLTVDPEVDLFGIVDGRAVWV